MSWRQVMRQEHEAEKWPDNNGEWLVKPSRHFRGARAAPPKFTINYETDDVDDRTGFIEWPTAPLSEVAKAAHRRVLSQPLKLKVFQNDKGVGFVNCAAVSWVSYPTAWGAGRVPNSNKECEPCDLWLGDDFCERHQSEYGLPFKGEFTPEELLDLYRAWAVLDFEKMTLPEVITAMREPNKYNWYPNPNKGPWRPTMFVGPNKRPRVS